MILFRGAGGEDIDQNIREINGIDCCLDLEILASVLLRIMMEQDWEQ